MLCLRATARGRLHVHMMLQGAALGYVAHLTHHLAIYLDVPLRFPLRLGNSHSWVLHHPLASSSIRWGHGYCW